MPHAFVGPHGTRPHLPHVDQAEFENLFENMPRESLRFLKYVKWHHCDVVQCRCLGPLCTVAGQWR
jgi:hypothetical protein